MTIELKPDATPCFAQPHPVPMPQRDEFQQKIVQLCAIGALQKLSAVEIERGKWTSPCYNTPKTDENKIRTIVDVRRLDNHKERQTHHHLQPD